MVGTVVTAPPIPMPDPDSVAPAGHALLRHPSPPRTRYGFQEQGSEEDGWQSTQHLACRHAAYPVPARVERPQSCGRMCNEALPPQATASALGADCRLTSCCIPRRVLTPAVGGFLA